ncbi:hypothetical protein H6F90_20260 [Trichocoleus sp. FACHB-591]|uniref:hypothetical protein n=1 Tax=Trichocoleus sp. FACHB-591 TaxID=2692872 RepID=UPI001683CE1E|nr:hypothetical protein [Trichocoleus sp. FACHB-591]MBD2097436.1 hypothetical protein [Trichocoleus sp. FACHB-591]
MLQLSSKKHEYVTALLIALVVWFSLFMSSGSLFSGYHFTDDHEITAIHYSFVHHQSDLFEVIKQWLVADHLSGRFRPLYYIHRIIETRIFGINFFLWSLYTGILAALTTFLLFVFGKFLKLSFSAAIVLAFLTTLGAQSAIWWQLGPAETIGFFLLSVALPFAGLSAAKSQQKMLYQSGFLVSTILMSLCKENLVVAIPAIAFIQVWLSRTNGSKTWLQAIKDNQFSLAVLGLVCLAELLFIKYFLGLRGTGYAGVEKINFSRILLVTKTLSHYSSGWIILSAIVLIFTINYKTNLKQSARLLLKTIYYPFFLFILLILPQLVVYAKSDISQRYLLPAVFGYSVLISLLYQHAKDNYKALDNIVLGLITLSLAINLSLAWNAACVFAAEGRSTQVLLKTITENTEVNQPILLITHPLVYVEWNLSIKRYLSYIAHHDNLYLGTYSPQKDQYFRKALEIYEQKSLEQISNKHQVQCIVVFPELNNAFLKRSSDWFVKTNYQAYVFGNFNRNLNPNSEIHLYCKK